MNLTDIATIVAKRDGVSKEEAWDMIRHCVNELDEIVAASGSYDDAADCVAYWLGLEPDYLPALLDV